ncbi:replication factor A [Halorussus sp. AFM4]|uniref:replication factor A n=1 Tax=Halorussus sp. AFM4 TaxID=3421651 RepID=UPI003EB8F359
MPDLTSKAEEVQQKLADQADIDAEVDGIEVALEKLTVEYRVPVDEAARSVINRELKAAGVESESFYQGDVDPVELASIDTDEEWVDVVAEVIDLWEPRSDSISQVGLLGDESGTLKFVSWETSDLPDLEEGEGYQLESVVTDEYQGNYSVKLNSATDITHCEDAEIDVGDGGSVFEGALVDIQSGSGLIKRCPEEDCTRVLENNRCSEHGEVDGEFDLRIKAVLDNGQITQKVIFNDEATEAVGGMSKEEAIELAMDKLDTTVVAQRLREKLLGRYFEVTGPEMGRYLLVDEFDQQAGPAQNDHESVLIKGRSL